MRSMTPLLKTLTKTAFTASALIVTALCFCHQALADQPNIVLILADDLGFSDIAPYGSEINTPNLSALAEEGIKFSNYHTAASCAPSRAMLLTGVDSHRNGVPNIPEAIPPEQEAHPHYQGTLSNSVVTIATLLKEAGYHTYMAGKWHLGQTPEQLPSSRGFERTFALADTGADNWEQKPYLPIYEKANWYADGKPAQLPDDFYSSRFLVDKVIEFIDSNQSDGQPFLAYLPFQAVHIPVQAPQEFVDSYMKTYDQGWSQLRQERLKQAVQLGLVPPETAMVTMSTTADWEALSEPEKRYQAKRMAVYAGMVEAMDFHIGRLMDYLRANGQYDNTIFIFTSDNGSEASGATDPEAPLAKFLLSLQGYHTDYETLGLKGSFNSIGPSFASASASPLAYYKFYAGDGGMRVPLIIAGPSLSPARKLSNAFSFVTDLAPTLLELAGVTPPARGHVNGEIEPIVGRSLVSLIKGKVERVHQPDTPVGYELGGNAALFQGDFKISLNRGPVGDNKWRLYNIVTDPGETKDLSLAMPERMNQMLVAYEAYANINHVLPVPEGYHQQRQVFIKGLGQRFGTELILIGLTLALVIVCIIYLLFIRPRFKSDK